MDTFWGIGENRQGSNQFGVVLMELRKNFVNSKKAEPPKLPERPEQINFSRFHHHFSNITPRLYYITYDDKNRSSAEHLFQAWKVRHSSFLTGMIDFQTSVK